MDTVALIARHSRGADVGRPTPLQWEVARFDLGIDAPSAKSIALVLGLDWPRLLTLAKASPAFRRQALSLEVGSVRASARTAKEGSAVYGPTDGRLASFAVRDVVARLATSGSALSKSDPWAAALAHRFDDLVIGYHRSARRRLASELASYTALFGPTPEWRLIASGKLLEGEAADLIWRGPQGVVIDDLHSDARTPDEWLALNRLARSLLTAVHRSYQRDLLGIRVILLRSPRLSLWYPRELQSTQDPARLYDPPTPTKLQPLQHPLLRTSAP